MPVTISEVDKRATEVANRLWLKTDSKNKLRKIMIDLAIESIRAYKEYTKFLEQLGIPIVKV